MPNPRQTTASLRTRKGKEKIVVLTAYTAPVARILDPIVDVLLVGDSLGMVLYGMETTLGVSLDLMIPHGRAVVKSSNQALVVVDMPFGSYQASHEQAFLSCARTMRETGCQAVKLEGGAEMAATIRFLTERGIPVMGHVGLKPQHVHQLGGYRVQAKSAPMRELLLADALAVEAAGAFAVVLEGVAEPAAREVTKKLQIPTIGIGASPACDGQVLVTEDMAGFFAQTPKFVRRYAELGADLQKAAERYAQDVRKGIFPGSEHCITGKQEK